MESGNMKPVTQKRMTLRSFKVMPTHCITLTIETVSLEHQQ